MQAKHTGKSLVVILFIAVVTYLVFVGWRKSNLPLQTNTSITNDSGLRLQAPLSISTENSLQETVGASVASSAAIQYENFLGSPVEAAEVNSWYAARGKFIEGDTEYLSYNRDTLEKLAADGDMRAMQVLGRRYLSQEYSVPRQHGFDAAKKQYWNAAVHGSTEALIALAIIERTATYDLTDDEAGKKAKALDVLAIYRVAELRGDLWSPDNQVPVFKELERITVSETEQAVIEQRAQQIYNDLQQQRTAVGLGNFDNSMPESVKKFFERVKGQRP